MDTRNYASLGASRRLDDAGIVLETEAFWSKGLMDRDFLLTTIPHKANHDEVYPAPSMAEVWRALPEIYGVHHGQLTLLCTGGTVTAAYTQDFGGGGISFDGSEVSTNPTDALIDLLIWVRKGQITQLNPGPGADGRMIPRRL